MEKQSKKDKTACENQFISIFHSKTQTYIMRTMVLAYKYLNKIENVYRRNI